MLEIRQVDLARALGVHHTTIARHAESLGIQAIEKSRKIKLYTLDDAIKIMKHMGLSDEEIARVIAKLQGSSTGQNNVGEEVQSQIEDKIEEEVKKEKTSKKSPIPATHIQGFLRSVDKAFATTFAKFAQQVDWFSTAVNEIGLFSIITAMSTMKLTPDELEERLFSYRDPYEFVHDVIDRLKALFRAAEDAKAVFNLQKRLEEYRYNLSKATMIIETLKRDLEELRREYAKILAVLYRYDPDFVKGYLFAKEVEAQDIINTIKLDGNLPKDKR